MHEVSLAVGKVGFPGRLESPGQPSVTRESQSQMIGPGEWLDIEYGSVSHVSL